jgi:hypothetical protein
MLRNNLFLAFIHVVFNTKSSMETLIGCNVNTVNYARKYLLKNIDFGGKK